jgi:hypothetical protein
MNADREAPDAGGPGDCARLDRRIAVGLLLATLAVRVLAASLVQLIAPDGVRYISMARQIGAGDLAGALAESYHPLYPLAIALFRPLAGGWESAALAVGVVFSSLGVLFLWGFARSVFGGRRPALVACVAYAFLPHFVRFHADALSEGLFHCCLLAGLWAGVRGFRDGRWGLLAVSGLSAGAAYLTRPEGVGLPLAFGLATAVWIAAGHPGTARRRVAARGLLLLTVFLAVAAPYLAVLRIETGHWDLSRKKTVATLSQSLEGKVEEGKEMTHPDVRVYSGLQAAAALGAEILRNLYVVPAFFAVLGLLVPWGQGRRPWRWELPALLASGAWCAMCLALLVSSGYISHRHPLPVAMFLLGHAGRGAAWASDALGRRLERIPPWIRHAGGRSGSSAILGVLLFLAVLAGCLVNFRPERREKLFEKEVGRDAASLSTPGAGMASDLVRIPYYAGARPVQVPLQVDAPGMLRLARAEGAELLIFHEAHLRTWAPALHAALTDPSGPPPGFRLERTWTFGGGVTVHAFRILPEPDRTR